MDKSLDWQEEFLTQLVGKRVRHILHGTWQPEHQRFSLWGEDLAQGRRHPRSKRGQHAAHPYPLSQAELLHYLDRYSTDSEPDGDTVPIWLPGLEKNVEPSPEAQQAGREPLTGDVRLLSWELPAITLTAADSVDFLVQLPEPRQIPGGFAVGADLAFWQQAALLAIHVLVEQRYLPALEKRGARFVAYWQPQLAHEMLARFSAAMPDLCRAMIADANQPPQTQALLEDFLRAAVDGIIREVYRPARKPLNPWTKALLDKGRTLSYSPAEAETLFVAWQRWRSSEAAGDPSLPFKVGLRLTEPEGGSPTWSLHYVLQAHDDPSLIVEAAQVWRARGRTLKYLEHRFEQPQEKLLEALGLAARLFPPIERSLHEASPVSVNLTPAEAYEFLVDAAPLLEQHQLAVLVPNWWARRTSALKVKGKLKGKAQESHGLFRLNSLLQFQWEVSLGDTAINRREFEQLVALKQPLVRFRGQWVALSPEQIQAALDFFKQHQPEETISVADALKITQDGTDPTAGIQIEAVHFEGKLNEVFKRLQNPERVHIPEIPKDLHGTLRPYQQRGFAWLTQMQALGLGACLADDMGLGKTPQTITFWLHQKEAGQLDRPALLICPTSVVGNWRHELARFAPGLEIYMHHGADRLRGDAFTQVVQHKDVVLTSYALLYRDLDTLKAVAWSSVVLDEAQNIKNAETKQARAARSLAADYRLALTGTPVENRLTELWSIMHFLNPGYFGSKENFRSQFSLPIERYQDKEAAARLRKLTAPLVLRRLKTDGRIIRDLPDKFENKVYCSLTPEQATLYEAVVREEIEAVENAESAMDRRGAVLRMLVRLKQICNHPAHFLKEGEALGVKALQGRSGKLARLTEMLEEVYSVRDRALIFTQYAEMGKHLQAYLAERFQDEVLFLYGSTPAKKRDEMIQAFQSDTGPALFVLSLKAGGTGLNLMHANHVFHFDRWYNPAVENQATDRAFRIGQTRNVQVHKFICLGTLEERIDEVIERKKGLAEQIVGEGEGWLTEMSNEELRDLVTLRRETVEEQEELA